MSLLERFLDLSIPSDDPDACWEWDGAHNDRGYGALWFGHRNFIYAHRFAYQQFVGDIPDGLHIDHLCRNPGCCNPSHLEAVTRQENMRRAVPFRTVKTHCPQGHTLSGENLFVNSKGYRECKTCRAHHARQRVLRLMVPCERCGAPCYPPSLRRTNTTVCRPCWFKGQSVEAAMKLGRRA